MTVGYRTPTPTRDDITIRFAGDSGDGMMLTGQQFTAASIHVGNDVKTYPYFPTEIRAPAGTPAAVSAFQVRFGNHALHGPGDRLDALVAMNPAALAIHLADLRPGGLLLINSDAFHAADIEKAGFESDPLSNQSLADYRVLKAPIHRLNLEAVSPVKLLAPREAERCRNLFALGLACWMFDRPLDPILAWIRETFSKNPVIVDAHTRTLKAGYHFGETTGWVPVQVVTEKSVLPPGRYRRITGNEALCMGLLAAAHQADRPLVFAGCPMVPASDLQQHFFDLKPLGVRGVLAEDEAGAIGMALGAAFAGALGVTATSGPGMCMTSEGLGLAVASELPLIVINVQRTGPGNGIPDHSEQGDLLQALFGRNGDSPLVVMAPHSPSDGFAVAREAVRAALAASTPVIILTDIYVGHGSEPWKIPTLAQLPAFSPTTAGEDDRGPFERKSSPVRPWSTPGTPDGEFRLTGLEKDEHSGNVSADPRNHERMVERRAAKIAALAESLPPLEIEGPATGDVLVLCWGSPTEVVREAVRVCQGRGLAAACVALRVLNPLPSDLGEVLGRFRRVLVPELNRGQLAWHLRARYLVDVISLPKTRARPFTVEELVEAIAKHAAHASGPTAAR